EMTARALLVDADALTEAQNAGDVLGANAILMDAFYTDVRPGLATWRESRGLPADPITAFNESGYLKEVAAARTGGTQAGWGASMRPARPAFPRKLSQAFMPSTSTSPRSSS